MTQCELLIIGTAPQNYMQVRRDMCVCVCVCVWPGTPRTEAVLQKDDNDNVHT